MKHMRKMMLVAALAAIANVAVAPAPKKRDSERDAARIAAAKAKRARKGAKRARKGAKRAKR